MEAPLEKQGSMRVYNSHLMDSLLKDEDKVSCATREVLEEVGYDISAQVRPDQYIETQWQQQRIRLYVVVGVPEDFPFATRTKKEIGDIAWFELKELPSGHQGEARDKRFWMIESVMPKLRRFLAKKDKGPKKKGAAQPTLVSAGLGV